MPTLPQPASASNYVFYYSESDDQPLSTHGLTDPSGIGSGVTEKGANGPASGMYMHPQFTFMLLMVLPM